MIPARPGIGLKLLELKIWAFGFMVEIVSMLRMLWFYLSVAVGLVLFLVTPILAAARLESLTVGYSNVTATYAPLWIAVDENIGHQVRFGSKGDLCGQGAAAATPGNR